MFKGIKLQTVELKINTSHVTSCFKFETHDGAHSFSLSAEEVIELFTEGLSQEEIEKIVTEAKKTLHAIDIQNEREIRRAIRFKA